MVIVKNDKNYIISELQNKWKVSTIINGMSVDYEVSKSDCATFDDLKAYVLSCDVF
mgnify:CR=1 FL=1